MMAVTCRGTVVSLVGFFFTFNVCDTAERQSVTGTGRCSWAPSLSPVKYDDIVGLLRVVRDHESATGTEAACSPCDTIALAEAMGLEPQEVADRLSAAI